MQKKNGLVSEAQLKEQKKRNQAVLQLALIIFAFLLGYIPFTGW